MAEWVKLRGETLRDGLGLSRATMPHAVAYRRVLGEALNIEEFEQALGVFFERCAAESEPLAIDGKSWRGTIAPGQTRGMYLLAVYAPETGVVLNQVNSERKENEISATPKLLGGVDLTGKVVTGDALFTPRDLST